ncbi:MAG: hypothetical protein AAF869_05500, partial [Pseudomonadota bacterium]
QESLAHLDIRPVTPLRGCSTGGRELRGLMGRDLVRQRADGTDGRRRRLYLSADGEGLVHKISARRTRRLAAAYRLAGPEAVAGFRAVLAALTQTRRNEE